MESGFYIYFYEEITSPNNSIILGSSSGGGVTEGFKVFASSSSLPVNLTTIATFE